MWQRIQTLYFVLIIGLMIASIILPNAMFYNPDKLLTYKLDARGIVEINNQGDAVDIVGKNPIMIIFGIILFLSTYCIAAYKDRRKQIRMATINLFLLIIYTFVLAGYIYVAKGKLDVEVDLLYPISFPIISLILNYLAMRGIAKDEKLVRSLDRLR